MRRIGSLILAMLLLLGMTACGTQTEKQDHTKPASASTGQNTASEVTAKEQVSAEDLGWGAVVSFGSYEQDNDPNNGTEPIEWIILDVQEDQMLLLSKKVLDVMLFDESGKDAYWDECTLRTWLNDTFFNESFNTEEQKAVLLTQVITPANATYETEAVPNTRDHVFLLSIDEAERYFQIAWGTSGHFYDNDIKAEATEYALHKGLEADGQTVDWYLRSTGWYGISGCSIVHASGWISGVWKLRSQKELCGIRPAVWVDLDADFELLRKQSSDTDTGLEDLFPTDWSGRYVLQEEENAVHIYCKKAYETGEKNRSLLFSVYYLTGDIVLPDSTALGTYDGYPVEAVVPWEIPAFSSDAVTAEYTDMIYNVGSILNALADRLAELEHFRQVSLFGFDLSLYSPPNITPIATGVYQLDCSSWSEQSKNELLGEYNHTSYLSVAPDGTAYLSLGSNEPIRGTLFAATDPNILPDGEPECIIWFENDGIVKPVYDLQLAITIYGMEEAELKEDAPKGLVGSAWTYTWVSGEYWTEESMRGDIG